MILAKTAVRREFISETPTRFTGICCLIKLAKVNRTVLETAENQVEYNYLSDSFPVFLSNNFFFPVHNTPDHVYY